MAAKMVLVGRGGRFGRAAMRVAAAGMLVLVVLGATIGAVRAGDSITVPNLTKEEFIKGCLEGNGINIVTEYPKTNTVMCEHDDGSYNICNFNPPTVCTSGGFYPDPDQNTSTTHGTVGGGTILDDSGQPAGTRPITTTTGTANSGTILDEDERP